MPSWAIAVSSLGITALFVFGVYLFAASEYADWVRDFYAKRTRLQTSIGDGKNKRNSSRT
ncbi:MAG: hypothetical protein DMG93_21065 [Acidobacteria bacterium]|nr:MAG: hypothetical protein DMG93_21065 [Acidobacteriota bacterium]